MELTSSFHDRHSIGDVLQVRVIPRNTDSTLISTSSKSGNSENNNTHIKQGIRLLLRDDGGQVVQILQARQSWKVTPDRSVPWALL